MRRRSAPASYDCLSCGRSRFRSAPMIRYHLHSLPPLSIPGGRFGFRAKHVPRVDDAVEGREVDIAEVERRRTQVDPVSCACLAIFAALSPISGASAVTSISDRSTSSAMRARLGSIPSTRRAQSLPSPSRADQSSASTFAPISGLFDEFEVPLHPRRSPPDDCRSPAPPPSSASRTGSD